MRRRVSALAIAVLAGGGLLAGGGAVAAAPCAGAGGKALLCPNLRIGPPKDLYLDDAGPGRRLLRATSDVRSRGHGPI
ncbi:MAG TPA: hypothetical protein VHI77_08040, partial [Solirubrobacterales bacterium]|nr:hypothetical protein [Solirubrobacterales bacterium]